MGRTCITGASGFIGRHLCRALSLQGRKLTLCVRRPLPADDPLSSIGDVVVTGELSESTDWEQALHGADAVVHLAARVHVMHESPSDQEREYHLTNVAATRNLAEQAAAAGIERFIFLSSVKAAGESGSFDEASAPCPRDAYGRSKLAAEQALIATASDTRMVAAILRPPLVYGPGVGANFLRLLRLVESRLPLPLASVNNRRSMVYSGNLVSAVQHLLDMESMPVGNWFISDDDPKSTPDLIRAIAASMNKASLLWPFPVGLLNAAAALVGRRAEFARLSESLVVDDRRIRLALSWQPPFSTEEGLRETIDWYSRQT